MSVRLIVRLLDAEVHLLGWCEVFARMPGDGTIRASGPSVIMIEQTGTPVWISVHWADAHVEVRTPLVGHRAVVAGETVALAWAQPIIVLGVPPTDLPCVTVRRPVVLAPPAGAFGASPSYLALAAPQPTIG